MIVRDAGDDWLLIAQPDHAHLSADLAAAVTAPPELPGGIVWADVVAAIRHHDDGWFERDTQSVWDPEFRRVRNFDEYSLPEATAIWRDSVRRVHALLTQPAEWFDRRIDRRLYEWTWCALSTEIGPISWSELLAKWHAQVGPPIPESDLKTVLDAMIGAGSAGADESGIALDVWHRPRASLGTLWVSGHFDALAELAEARHADNPTALATAHVFHADHRRWREAAANACGSLVTGEDFQRLVEIGTRAVRFFDRLSLELCLRPPGVSRTIAMPGWPQVEWGTSLSSAIICEPDLFVPDAKDVSVTARRVPKAAMRDSSAWAAAWRSAPVKSLRWAWIAG